MGESNGTSREAAASSRRRVLAFRVLLLLLAAGAALAAVFIGLLPHQEVGASAARFVCPMHPQVTSAVAGECPICRMALEPINRGGPGASSAIAWSTYQGYDIVRRRGYCPDFPSPAWVDGNDRVQAIVYDDELGAVAAGAHGVFTPAGAGEKGGAPGASIEVYAGSEPVRRWDRSTSRVVFRMDAASAAENPLRAGDVGWLRLLAKEREFGVLPYGAILEAAEGPYVLVASPEGRMLSKRSVQIGRVFGGQALVVSGLRAQERVLVRGAFFVDAERRLRREPTIEVTQ